MRLLDIGCGPGSITLDLADLLPDGQVVGVENSQDALLTARGAAAERGDERTRFDVADAHALPYAGDSFDVVHAHQVLQHVADPVQVLREMRRVCRPGGLIAARDADYAAMAWYPESAGLQKWRAAYRAIARHNGGEPDAGRHFREWTRHAGLGDVTITVSCWTYADSAGTRWWGNSQANRVGGEVFTEQARHLAGLGSEDVAGLAAAWRDWGTHPDAWFLLPHVELLARA